MDSSSKVGLETNGASFGGTRYDIDNAELLKLGKKPVLKRKFGFVSMMAFEIALAITWPAVLILFSISYTNGGSAGSIYEFLFVWVGSLAAFTTMGELASMAPTVGGQYHWVSMLAPKFCRKFLSYFIGWLTMIGWQAIVASACYLTASLVQGLMVFNDSTYQPKAWQLMLLYWATLLLSILVNTFISHRLPIIEVFMFFLQILGFFAILIPMVYLGPHGDAREVFTSFVNGGKWPTDGISFLIGSLGPSFALLGPDCAVHLSEEIRNPARNVPWSMLFGILVNGSLGFGMLVALLFCLGDADAAMASPTHYPFMEILLQAVGSLPGALTMAALATIACISSTINAVATGSRMTWAFARDRGTPGWKTLSKVESRSALPVMAVIFTMIISVLLSFISLGSTVAFNDVVSLSINGLYTSYFIGNTLLLYRRVTGGIKPYAPADKTLANTIDAEYLTWGPWKVQEPFGTIINIFGCIYLFAIFLFSFWPITNHPDAASMNYSSLMCGAVAIFSVVYYLCWGKRSYVGPVVELDAAARN